MRAVLVIAALLAVTAVGVSATNCLTTAGLNAIKGYESFRAKQYYDSAHILTIGYGTLCKTGSLKCPGPVTEAAAAKVLGKAIESKYAPCVRAALAKSKTPANNNQYSALISFAYNTGCGSMAAVASSAGGVLSKFPDHMINYNKATVKGKLQVIPGLTKRRKAEIALFKNPKVGACSASFLESEAHVTPRMTRELPPGAGKPVVPGSDAVHSHAQIRQIERQNIAHSSIPFPVHAQPKFKKHAPHRPSTQNRVVATAVDTGRVNWIRSHHISKNAPRLKMGGLNKHHKRHHHKHGKHGKKGDSSSSPSGESATPSGESASP